MTRAAPPEWADRGCVMRGTRPVCRILVVAPTASAQVKPVLQAAVSGDDSKVAVIVTGELPPGGTTGRHTHPGDEYTLVLEGTLELRADGRAPRRVSAGEAYHNPRGLIHEARNVGDGPARVSITFIIGKGKPVTQPAE
jgi:quercetin dioxygenase-like cupin family protein